jgi:urea transporter
VWYLCCITIYTMANCIYQSRWHISMATHFVHNSGFYTIYNLLYYFNSNRYKQSLYLTHQPWSELHMLMILIGFYVTRIFVFIVSNELTEFKPMQLSINVVCNTWLQMLCSISTAIKQNHYQLKCVGRWSP